MNPVEQGRPDWRDDGEADHAQELLQEQEERDDIKHNTRIDSQTQLTSTQLEKDMT